MLSDNEIWLQWITKLQSIAQNGLTFTKDPYDKERYEQLMHLTAEIANKYLNIESDKIMKVFSAEIGYYATPKICVRGAIFNKKNEILLVKESDDRLWSLPGGWADVNETPSENVIKEIFEESGYISKVTKLIAIYDRNKQVIKWPHLYNVFFLCEIIGGELKVSHDILDAGFFNMKKLPPLSIERMTELQIQKCYECHTDLNTNADFD